jgi:hypothetical protein
MLSRTFLGDFRAIFAFKTRIFGFGGLVILKNHTQKGECMPKTRKNFGAGKFMPKNLPS